MRCSRGGICVLLAASALAPFVVGAAPDESATTPEKALVIGAAPFLKPSLMDQYFQPIASYLSRSTGKPVELAVAKSYSAFEEVSKAGVYDLMFSPSVAAVGKDAILIATSPGVEVHIVTSRRRGIESLEELRGKTVASVRASTAESMGVQLLLKAGLEVDRDVTLRREVSHDQVILSVLEGRSDAGITSVEMLQLLRDELHADFLVLATSPPSHGILVLANPRLEPALLRQIQNLLESFDDASESVKPAGNMRGFEFKAVPLERQ